MPTATIHALGSKRLPTTKPPTRPTSGFCHCLCCLPLPQLPSVAKAGAAQFFEAQQKWLLPQLKERRARRLLLAQLKQRSSSFAGWALQTGTCAASAPLLGLGAWSCAGRSKRPELLPPASSSSQGPPVAAGCKLLATAKLLESFSLSSFVAQAHSPSGSALGWQDCPKAGRKELKSLSGWLSFLALCLLTRSCSQRCGK